VGHALGFSGASVEHAPGFSGDVVVEPWASSDFLGKSWESSGRIPSSPQNPGRNFASSDGIVAGAPITTREEAGSVSIRRPKPPSLPLCQSFKSLLAPSLRIDREALRHNTIFYHRVPVELRLVRRPARVADFTHFESIPPL
jgi:hypothetical protein